MRSRLWECLIAAVAGILVGCAGPDLATQGSALPGGRSEQLPALEGEACTHKTVVALCAGDDCRFYWCDVVAPALASVRRLRNPDGTWIQLPGAISMHPEPQGERVGRDMFLTSGVGGAGGAGDSPSHPRPEGERVGVRDVVQQILILQKPGAVLAWWASDPGAKPERWSHPLTEWERKYIEAMGTSKVPAPIRMWPLLTPERLTPQLLHEAEGLFGRGSTTAQAFCNWENRRRLVSHYVKTHPATIRLELAQYGLFRDANPIHFSFERGWQVAGGKEMFTEQDISQLGAAADFFVALAAGVATGKVMGAARPLPPEEVEGVASTPLRGDLNRDTHAPDALGKMVPLDQFRRLRNPLPGEAPARAAEPLAATGTDGAPGKPGKGATTARLEPREGGGDGPAILKAARVRSNVIASAEDAGLESLVDEAAGLTRDVLDAQLAVAEDTEPGARLPWDLEAVRKAKPTLERPPPGVAPDSVLWREHSAYYEKRLAAMEAADAAGKRQSVKPPREWSSYRTLREDFARGIAFQRAQVAKLPELAKRLGFSKPYIQANAGVKKADLRFADALIVETDPTRPARAVSVSFKSRNLGEMTPQELGAQFKTDATTADTYYGGDLDVRTPALRRLGYERAKVEGVYLIYDSDGRLLGNHGMDLFKDAMERVTKTTGVEVRFP